jgi:hypothetical protein
MLKRILLNAVDQGGGNAAAAPATPVVPAAPAAAAATPAAPAQGAPLTREDLKTFAADVRNGVFADLRRAGVLGNGGERTTTTQQQPATPAAPTGHEPAPDPMALRRLDRALARVPAERLTPAMYERLERLFSAEAPRDAEAWVSEFFPVNGAAQPAAAAQAAAVITPNTPAVNPTGPTVSDRGAPAATKVPAEDADILEMSEDDRKALLKAKGTSWFAAKLREQMKGRRISVR